MLSAVASDSAGATEAAAAAFIDSLPHVFDGLWAIAADLPVVWAVGPRGDRRRRPSPPRSRPRPCSSPVVIAGLGRACSATASSRAPGRSLDELLGNGSPVTFPAGRLAVAVAMIVTASPHLSRPLRYAGRWVIGLGTIGTVYTQEATRRWHDRRAHPRRHGGGGRPPDLRVARRPPQPPRGRGGRRATSASMLATSDPPSSNRQGCGPCSAEDAAGEPLVIKVYGRDAWDTQLVTQAWRFLWYRHSSARLRLSRERQVEHEALLLLLAQHGVRRRAEGAGGRAGAVRRHLLAIEPVAEPGAVGALDRLWARARHRARRRPVAVLDRRRRPRLDRPRATGSSAAGRAG